MIRPLALVLALALPLSAALAQDVVYRIPVTGVIENGLAPYIERALSTAAENGAALVVLDIDTPGGRVDAAERIADAVRRSTVPVAAYVNPRAFSAGALIALSANRIYMMPGGVMGAATPVDGQGTKASEKMVSAMRAEFRALAEARGRDPAIAEAMVDESLAIEGVSPAGQLLTMSTSEAIAVGYAEGLASSLDEVTAAFGIPDPSVTTLSLTWAEKAVRFLTNPIVSPLLLSLGLLGLMLEIKAGAFGLGGMLSVASLGLFFGSSMLIGLAGWEEVILLGVGMIAIAVEVFIIPGFGVAGVLGIGMIGVATLMALLGSAPTGGDWMSALAVIGVALVITAAVFFAWLRHLPNSQRWKGLLLQGDVNRTDGYISAPERAELIGREAVALTDLRPSGTAEIDDERIDVVTDGEFIKAGSKVTVLRSEGYRLVVRVTRALTNQSETELAQ